DQEVDARRQRGEDLGMRQRRALGVARLLVEIEAEAVSAFQPQLAGGEGAEAQLRSLQVSKDADRSARRFLQCADGLDSPLVVAALAMAEIEPEDVDAGMEQSGDDLRCRGRRTERGNDLGAALTTHVLFPRWAIARPEHQDGAEIVNICSRRPGDDEIPQRLERAVP